MILFPLPYNVCCGIQANLSHPEGAVLPLSHVEQGVTAIPANLRNKLLPSQHNRLLLCHIKHSS